MRQGILRYGKCRGCTWAVGGAGSHGVYVQAGGVDEHHTVRAALERCVVGHKNWSNLLVAGQAFAKRVNVDVGGVDTEAAVVKNGCGGMTPNPGARNCVGTGTHNTARTSKHRNCFHGDNMEATSVWIVAEIRKLDPLFRDRLRDLEDMKNDEITGGTLRDRPQLVLERYDPAVPPPAYPDAVPPQPALHPRPSAATRQATVESGGVTLREAPHGVTLREAPAASGGVTLREAPAARGGVAPREPPPPPPRGWGHVGAPPAPPTAPQPPCSPPRLSARKAPRQPPPHRRHQRRRPPRAPRQLGKPP